MTFSGLYRRTLDILHGRWGSSILACLVFSLVSGAAGNIPGVKHFAGLLLIPLNLGLFLYFLCMIREDKRDIGILFQPYQQLPRMLWAGIRPFIFIFLWTLLLVIPGIIAGYRYALTWFLVLDYPEMSVKDAMTKSCELMNGHKIRLFFYSFILSLICFFGMVLTLGIGLIWLVPFSAAFVTVFYLAVKAEKMPEA